MTWPDPELLDGADEPWRPLLDELLLDELLCERAVLVALDPDFAAAVR